MPKFIIITTALLFVGCATYKPYLEVLPMGKTSAKKSIDIKDKHIKI